MTLVEGLVSVGIPAYNHENYIQETIRSIINQTYQNIELIILDDESQDSTWEKIQEMKQECEERFVRVHFERQKNMGCSRTNHKLITLAQGEYYMVIASDDLAKPNAIEIEHKFLSENPDYVHCTGDNDLIDSDSNFCVMDSNRCIIQNYSQISFNTVVQRFKYELKKKFGIEFKHSSDYDVTYKDLWYGNSVPNIGLYKTEAIKTIDRQNIMWSLDDWALHFQMLKLGKYKILSDVVGSYRLHDEQQIKNTKKLTRNGRLTQYYEIHLLETKYQEFITKELYDSWFFMDLKNKYDKTKNSPYWDEKYYTQRYPWVLEDGYLPVVHYLTIGIAKGYLPCKKFEQIVRIPKGMNLALEWRCFFGFEYIKNKIRYKIWRHFTKILLKKRILNGNMSLNNSINSDNNYFYKKESKYKLFIGEYLQKKSRKKIFDKFKENKKLKISFLAQRPGMWCFDYVYKIFKNDSRFDVDVVVMPDARYDKDFMIKCLKQTEQELLDKNIKPVLGYDIKNDKVLNFKKEINPDIIFYSEFWKPHFKKEFYITNFLDKITLLNDYGFSVKQEELTANFELNNLVDIYFRPSDVHINMAKEVMDNGGINTIATRSPKLDMLFDEEFKPVDVWKKQEKTKKRIIWAPHYNSNTPSSMYQNDGFWFLHEFMLTIAEKYKDDVQFIFRPHPVLYTFLTKVWGEERTQEYYEKWDKLENGQYFTGEFADLFATSDAMIMDCCSFMAEYTAFNKPLFHTVTKTSRTNMNSFGEILYENFYIPTQDLEKDIEDFIQDVVINGNDYKKEQRTQMVQECFGKINGKTASENIYDEIIKFLEKGEV